MQRRRELTPLGADEFRLFLMAIAASQGYRVKSDSSPAELTAVLLWFLAQPRVLGTLFNRMAGSSTDYGKTAVRATTEATGEEPSLHVLKAMMQVCAVPHCRIPALLLFVKLPATPAIACIREVAGATCLGGVAGANSECTMLQ